MFQTERLRLIHCTFLLQWMTIFMGVYPFTSRSTVRSHPWYSNCQADEIPGSISAALSVPSQSLPRSGGEARAHFANSSWQSSPMRSYKCCDYFKIPWFIWFLFGKIFFWNVVWPAIWILLTYEMIVLDKQSAYNYHLFVLHHLHLLTSVI